MRTNVKSLEETLKKSIGEKAGIEIAITSNKKKIKQGQVAIEIVASTENEAAAENEVCTTIICSVVMFIIEKERRTNSEDNGPTPVSVIVANKRTNDIIFSNFGVNSVDKSVKYLSQYVDRCIDFSTGNVESEDSAE